MTPFEVFKTDIDEFILLCNYLVNLSGEKTPQKLQDEKKEAATFWAAL